MGCVSKFSILENSDNVSRYFSSEDVDNNFYLDTNFPSDVFVVICYINIVEAIRQKMNMKVKK